MSPEEGTESGDEVVEEPVVYTRRTRTAAVAKTEAENEE